MAHGPRILGVLLAIALAISALADSLGDLMDPVASATTPGKFTAAQYPATLVATGTTAHRFTAFGAEVTCGHAKFDGGLTASSFELHVTPTYSNCHAVVLGAKFPATVKHNECEYEFWGVHTENEPFDYQYTSSTDISCPKGKELEIVIYLNSHSHSTGVPICTVTLETQRSLTGMTADVTNNTPLSSNDVDVSGAITEIHAQIHRKSLFCPGTGETATTTEATYHLPTTESGGVTVQAEKEESIVSFDIG